LFKTNTTPLGVLIDRVEIQLSERHAP